jgi:hypothetical protein
MRFRNMLIIQVCINKYIGPRRNSTRKKIIWNGFVVFILFNKDFVVSESWTI